MGAGHHPRPAENKAVSVVLRKCASFRSHLCQSPVPPSSAATRPNTRATSPSTPGTLSRRLARSLRQEASVRGSRPLRRAVRQRPPTPRRAPAPFHQRGASSLRQVGRAALRREAHHRWRSPGVRGVRLECLRIGGIWHTSWESFKRFYDRLTNSGDDASASAPPARPGQSAGDEGHQDRVERELRERGA